MMWALKRMGHEVITVGPAVGAYLPWAHGRNMEPYEWKPDVPLVYDHDKQTDADVMMIDSADVLNRLRKAPDLIIQMDARFIMQGKAPCPNVLYAIDNHVSAYGEYDSFDRIFIAHSWGNMADLPQAEWLPCGHDPLNHYVIDELRERALRIHAEAALRSCPAS